MWFDQTGLPWVMPSPNMPTLETATVYPGMCLFEGTNISEGRGTTRPFEIFGAPFIDAEKLCTELNGLKLARRFLSRKLFSANVPKICRSTLRRRANSRCRSKQFPPFETGIEIIRAIRSLYPDQFEWKQPPYEYEREKLPIEILLGGP
jgi:Uncharacterized protein conserved in bacteria